MKLIFFSKMLQELTLPQLAETAHRWGLDGFDLCVRPGFPVCPDNVAEALPHAAALLRAEGLDIPMVTGHFDLLAPTHPTAEPLLAAMEQADIRHLKLGYFPYRPWEMDYRQALDSARRTLAAWEPLARRHHVRICYHSHSRQNLGLNGASLAHLFDGLDPDCFGVYLDPAHLLVEGEDPATAIGMVRPWLALIALKDVAITRAEQNGHGSPKPVWTLAGNGMVDWTHVFDALDKAGFDGPCSVHCEFRSAIPDHFHENAQREVDFFRTFVHH